MKYKIVVLLLFVIVIALAQCTKHDRLTERTAAVSDDARENHPTLIAEGKNTFRFDTFGDEDFWSGLLHLDKAIAGSANGGFGPGVSPNTALAVGLKVDAEALPAEVVAGIQSGDVKLDDPATTLA